MHSTSKSQTEVVEVDEIHRTKEFQSHSSTSSDTVIKSAYYHVFTVWLFTFSDLKTIVLPSTAFGILNTLAISIRDDASSSNYIQILGRIPIVLLWTWINLLPFAINNQRQPEAIQEDLLNKPWRSMPSGRISSESAKYLMLVTYLLAIFTSQVLGNSTQCLTLVALGFWYNDLHGADASCLVRNLINAAGFVCFISGAMQAALGNDESALKLMGWWYGVIGCIVFSTVQTQDMYDQRGDAIRSRKTVPLVVGDALARWTIAIPMTFWCWFAPWLWGLSILGYLVPVSLGMTVVGRTLSRRSESADKTTFRLWNLWMVSVYMLPLVKEFEAFALAS